MIDIHDESINIIRDHLLVGFHAALKELPDNSKLNRTDFLIALDELRQQIWEVVDKLTLDNIDTPPH